MPEPTREEILAVLEPFAEMHREGCDLDEVACDRGWSSDRTILTSRNFAEAAALHARLSQPVAESAEPGPSDALPRRVGYSTTTDARLIGSCADELEQLGQWVRAARDFDRDDAVDEIARAIENRVRELRAAMRKERP